MMRRLGALQAHLSPSTDSTAAESSSPPLRVAVTGTSVGIGLEFVRQYADAGARVYALCRSPAAASDLAAVAAASNGRVTVHALDQTDAESVASLREELSGVPLDIMINNAVRPAALLPCCRMLAAAPCLRPQPPCTTPQVPELAKVNEVLRRVCGPLSLEAELRGTLRGVRHESEAVVRMALERLDSLLREKRKEARLPACPPARPPALSAV